MCSISFTLEGIQLIIDLSLLSSQLLLSSTEGLTLVQPLQLLSSIIEFMLQQLDGNSGSPILGPRVPGANAL